MCVYHLDKARTYYFGAITQIARRVTAYVNPLLNAAAAHRR